MSLNFDPDHGAHYRSLSQKIRVMSEQWVHANQFCPACGFTALSCFSNNRPVADFLCEECGEQFELKAKNGRLGPKIVDGAYRTMIERITCDTNPNFLLLTYNKASLQVTDLVLIPKHFFLQRIIVSRTRLASTAKRAGWQGCNILLDSIPASGRIELIARGAIRSKADVVEAWQNTIFLRQQKDATAKGWLLSVMCCVEKLRKRVFTLQDIYSAETDLSTLFPGNRHIRPKIRQQLQVLRDQGYLEFIEPGVYRCCQYSHAH